MKIICMNHDGEQRLSFTLKVWSHYILPSLLLAAFMGGLLFYQAPHSDPSVISSGTNDVNGKDPYIIELDVLARKVGALEAEALRLNAFSSHLVKMAKLDPDEFSFDKKPSLGGLPSGGDVNVENASAANGLMSSIQLLEGELKGQRKRLENILDKLNGRILENRSLPSSMPVLQGYISSLYGVRHDPFTGKNRMHEGVDFAAGKGTKVYAMGSGVVSFAGKNGGYGTVVEINHGKGLVSRYAHLSKTFVSVGDVIKRDTEIAEIGSTGRSTGPHLHLEILKNGVHEDPEKYFSHYKM